MECFVADFLHLCSTAVKIWLLRNRLSTFQSIPRIFKNSFKFPNFVKSYFLSGWGTPEAAQTFIFRC